MDQKELANSESYDPTKCQSSVEFSDNYLYERPQFRKGKLSAEEKNRFKQALLRYGKDWRMLEWKVGTRSRKVLMTFAEKFKVKMKKVVQTPTDGSNIRVDSAEVAQAQRCVTILESKPHKTFSRLLPAYITVPECEDTADQIGMFIP